MLFYLIKPHAPKPGAVVDADGAGPLPTIFEAIVCSSIVDRVVAIGQREGLQIENSPGANSGERRRNSACLAAGRETCAIEIHGNIGHGSYGGAFYRPDSSRGERVARAIEASMDSLRTILPGYHCEPWAADAQWPNCAAALAYTRKTPDSHSGILLEIAFLDNTKHAEAWTTQGVEAVANAIVHGLKEVK